MYTNSLLAGNLFFTSALIASLLLYICFRPSRREALSVAGVGLALLVACGTNGPAYGRVMLAIGYFGVSALAVNLICLYASPIRRQARARLLAQMAVGPMFMLVLVVALACCARINPVYDRHLYAFDGAFGLQPGFAAARLLLAYEVLRIITEIAYCNLPLAAAAVFVLLRSKSPALADELIRVLVALGIVGYACYFLLPAVGSAAAFKETFPYHEPVFERNQIMPVIAGFWPRNGMPSLHAAWAFALWRRAQHLSKRVRAALALYLLLLLLYTLACHYFVDIVVALPLSLAVAGLAEQPGRLRTGIGKQVLSCAALTVLWLVMIRFGTSLVLQTPIISWAMLIGTVVVCVAVASPAPAEQEAIPELACVR